MRPITVWSAAALALAVALLGAACDDDVADAPASSASGAATGTAGHGGTGAGGAGASGGSGGESAAAGGQGGGPAPECGHDVCALGDYLEASCDACTAAVCAEDDWCCSLGWDEYCVLLVQQLPDVCSCAPETVCSGMQDEDLDGLRDCADPDCAASCAPGATPIGDPCTAHGECAASQPICFDEDLLGWSDGYCSGFCDTAAADCGAEAVCVLLSGSDDQEYSACLRRCDPAAAGDCRPGYRCVDDVPDPFCAPVPEDCTNGVDDNLDGEADCADNACHQFFDCFESCDNGLDDNGDGDIDCADWSCAGVPACLQWSCEPPPPTPQTSCIAVGGAVACHPITNEGCEAGQLCDAHLGAYAFQCVDGPGTEAVCAPCGPEAPCAQGHTCVATNPDLSDAQCARFCCTSDDCGGELCNKAVVTTLIGGIPSPVGVCMQPVP